MLFESLVRVSNEVARESSRIRKVEKLAAVLKQMTPDEIPVGVAFLSGQIRQGRIGLGYASVRDASPGASAAKATLSLLDVDAAFKGLAARSLKIREAVLDGEALVFEPDGRPAPFQVTMRRFGRRLNVDEMKRRLPLTPFSFDALRFEGEDLIGRPTHERLEALGDMVAHSLIVPRLETAAKSEARRFLERALRAGHEGLMAKSLEAPYEAGRRGANWLKIKPSHTLDLVVLAAEWGSGRRRGRLSNIHLAARDPKKGFVMLGKTFKGMTDEMLEWQTRRFLELETGRDEYTVFVRPEVVVEVAFDGVQESPQYPGGLALRFARVKRYRPDKTADQADTIDLVRAIYLKQRAKG